MARHTERRTKRQQSRVRMTPRCHSIAAKQLGFRFSQGAFWKTQDQLFTNTSFRGSLRSIRGPTVQSDISASVFASS